MIYFLAAVAAIAGFLFGYDEGVIAVARPSLDKDFPMGPLVGGFMTAAVPLGALAAASVAGRDIDRFGRRRVLMAAAALFALGALIAAAITAIWMLVACPPRPGTGDRRRGSRRTALHRGNRAASKSAAPWSRPISWRSPSASSVSYLTGLVISGDGTWRTHVRTGRRAGTAVSCRTGLLPESPRWLVLKGFPGEARASLRRLRARAGTSTASSARWSAPLKPRAGRRAGYRALLEPAIRPALIVAVGLFFLQQLSGINAVIYYAPEIFSHAGFDSVEHADAGNGRRRDGRIC